jgi:hypothetical protein
LEPSEWKTELGKVSFSHQTQNHINCGIEYINSSKNRPRAANGTASIKRRM